MDYCEQCGCPAGALAPPPSLDRWDFRPQRLRGDQQQMLGSADLAILGVLCGCVGWMPLYVGLAACLAAALLGGTARHRARQERCNGPGRWLSWVPVVMAGMGAACTLSGL